jgi:hypothetical protein
MLKASLKVLLAAGLSLPSAAFAQGSCVGQSAVLAGVSGDVMVSTGAGFAPAQSGAALVAGDRVIAKRGAATLSFGPKCSVQVKRDSSVLVGEQDSLLTAVNALPEGEGWKAQEAVGLGFGPAALGVGLLVLVGGAMIITSNTGHGRTVQLSP